MSNAIKRFLAGMPVESTELSEALHELLTERDELLDALLRADELLNTDRRKVVNRNAATMLIRAAIRKATGGQK